MSDQKEVIALELDYKGKECYEINFDMRLKIKEIEIGQILKMVTDNPQSNEKIIQWCSINHQELFLSNFENGLFTYYIKRKS